MPEFNKEEMEEKFNMLDQEVRKQILALGKDAAPAKQEKKTEEPATVA